MTQNANIGRTIGGYHLIRQIGFGGMSTVYEAHNDGGERFALKLLHPSVAADESSRTRLSREVAMLQRVRGRYVAEVIDAEIDAFEPFIVTELIDGLTLEKDVLQNGFYTEEDLVQLGQDLADALHSIHRVGVLHRDLKPSNVMIGAQGPVLIDFGIAQLEDDVRLTQQGAVTLTPGYSDPRVVRGSAPDEAADWWALAAVLAFAANGSAPFQGSSSPAVIHSVLAGDIYLPELTGSVARAFRSALAPDLSERISFEDLLAAVADPEPDEVTDVEGDGAGETQRYDVTETREYGAGETREYDVPETRPYGATETRPYEDEATQAIPEPSADELGQTQVMAEQPAPRYVPPTQPTAPYPQPNYPQAGYPQPGAGPMPAYPQASFPQLGEPEGPPELPDWMMMPRPNRVAVLMLWLGAGCLAVRWPIWVLLVVAGLMMVAALVGDSHKWLRERRMTHGGRSKTDGVAVLAHSPFSALIAVLTVAFSTIVAWGSGYALGWVDLLWLWGTAEAGVRDLPALHVAGIVAFALAVAWFFPGSGRARFGGRVIMAGPKGSARKTWWLLIALFVLGLGVYVAITQPVGFGSEQFIDWTPLAGSAWRL